MPFWFYLKINKSHKKVLKSCGDSESVQQSSCDEINDNLCNSYTNSGDYSRI